MGAIAAALLASLFVLWLRPVIERSIRARIESAALRQGMVLRIETVDVGIWPLLRLEHVELELGHGLLLRADAIAATWPGTLRLSVRGAALSGPADLAARLATSDWKVTGLFGNTPQLTLLSPQTGVSLQRQAEPSGSAWTLEMRGLAIGQLIELRRDGQPVFEGGIADGRVALQTGTDSRRFDVDFGLRAVRLVALEGAATDLTLRFEGQWQRKHSSLEIPQLRATLDGAELSGALSLQDLATDPGIDLALGMKRLDFAKLLGTSGLEVPDSLGLRPGKTHDLGSAAIDVRVRGRLSEPAALTVNQTIDFTPPHELPPGITRLRGDFDFTPASGTGQDLLIHVSPESPDFIALRDVPPLFLRTLLLAEDSAFYGHRGIDLREMPSALVTNWSRGGAARGASTITQQLAKNLFLSRDKQVGRKLQELAISFLLESALGKARILEIYLNIIEWGPGLRGLKPAARHYFDSEPAALTPAQMAFLVSIIPGPILYQRSMADGMPGPGLRTLVDNLLAKLRSVEAISEVEYGQALADPLSLRP